MLSDTSLYVTSEKCNLTIVEEQTWFPFEVDRMRIQEMYHPCILSWGGKKPLGR